MIRGHNEYIIIVRKTSMMYNCDNCEGKLWIAGVKQAVVFGVIKKINICGIKMRSVVCKEGMQ